MVAQTISMENTEFGNGGERGGRLSDYVSKKSAADLAELWLFSIQSLLEALISLEYLFAAQSQLGASSGFSANYAKNEEFN